MAKLVCGTRERERERENWKGAPRGDYKRGGKVGLPRVALEGVRWNHTVHINTPEKSRRKKEEIEGRLVKLGKVWSFANEMFNEIDMGEFRRWDRCKTQKFFM